MNESAIKSALVSWLKKQLGKPAVKKILFNADFVTGNQIAGSVNAQAWATVAFDTDQATTIEALADEISKLPGILKALVTGAREITVTGAHGGVDLVFVGPTVTGGASQAVATVSELQAAQAVEVILAEQNSPRPDYPYAVIRLSSIERVGWDEFRGVDPETRVAEIVGQRQATVSVDFFGEEPEVGQHSRALEEIEKARTSLHKPSVQQELSAAGISIQLIGTTQNLTAMLETIFEDHANFDFFIGLAESVEDNVGFIEQVEFEGKADGEDQGPETVDAS